MRGEAEGCCCSSWAQPVLWAASQVREDIRMKKRRLNPPLRIWATLPTLSGRSDLLRDFNLVKKSYLSPLQYIRFAIDGLTEKLHMFACRKESETLSIIKKHLPFVSSFQSFGKCTELFVSFLTQFYTLSPEVHNSNYFFLLKKYFLISSQEKYL